MPDQWHGSSSPTDFMLGGHRPWGQEAVPGHNGARKHQFGAATPTGESFEDALQQYPQADEAVLCLLMQQILIEG